MVKKGDLISIFYLDIPIQRKHEIAWLLVKNDFKAHKYFQDIFYNNKNIIYLRPFPGFRDDSYIFSIHFIENDAKKETYKMRGYEEIENFIKNPHKTTNYPANRIT